MQKKTLFGHIEFHRNINLLYTNIEVEILSETAFIKKSIGIGYF